MSLNCLIHFFQEISWNNFIITELNSLLELENENIKINKNEYEIESNSNDSKKNSDQNLNKNLVFLNILLNENIAIKICKRSVLIKNIYEIWAG